jgi:hypothetical protein
MGIPYSGEDGFVLASAQHRRYSTAGLRPNSGQTPTKPRPDANQSRGARPSSWEDRCAERAVGSSVLGENERGGGSGDG